MKEHTKENIVLPILDRAASDLALLATDNDADQIEAIVNAFVQQLSRKQKSVASMSAIEREALLRRASQGSEIEKFATNFARLSHDTKETLLSLVGESAELSEVIEALPEAKDVLFTQLRHESFDHTPEGKKKKNEKTDVDKSTARKSKSNTKIVGRGPGAHFQTTPNPCAGKKPNWQNTDCLVDDVVQVIEQAGGDVTAGFVGGLDVSGREPLTTSYWKNSLCPVNVHWHLGAEHRSQGQFDENGKGPNIAGTPATQNLSASVGEVRYGFACQLFDSGDSKFTKEYEWKHCKDMHVGETYEIHWPHSALGACHTPHQYQSPFYDGVFCHYKPATDHAALTAQDIAHSIGVQGQVFTVVNDEDYYYPDLINGMIKDGDYGADIAAYTGSTTGTSRNNKVCSAFSPITWQVDRKCHLISASSFDKLCSDMKEMRDDMSGDVHPHGARELTDSRFVANNLNEPSAGEYR